MTRLGFVLDQRSCIGCHACTVACKQEHDVELGVFRTWVKYIEEGTFPDVRRQFSVMRCNQCDDAPCITVCPVTALYRREDGIVDFDPDRCIGCKACMNACPYDALYIDPHSNTAAKCNFCAHRVEQGLKPSCEVACPTHAIISGDLDDPGSEVSVLLDVIPAQVRAPEQGTNPKVFYLGATEASLDPLAVARAKPYLNEYDAERLERLAPLDAGATASLVADASHHPAPWGWRVSSYFLTKGVAAGAMMLAVLLRGEADLLCGLLALAGIAATGVLLIADLKRPERFHYLFLHPQWRSWLAIGTQIIAIAGAVALAFVVSAGVVRDVLAWVMVPAGAALAGYTALLFNQCEGRDLWQSRLLLPHTVVNALLAGSAALALAAPVADVGAIAWVLAPASVVGAAFIALDAFGRHPTRQAERAALNLRRDRFARRFWTGATLAAPVPAVVGAAALVTGSSALLAVAGAAALAGLWLYEDAWVRAGQSVPLS